MHEGNVLPAQTHWAAGFTNGFRPMGLKPVVLPGRELVALVRLAYGVAEILKHERRLRRTSTLARPTHARLRDLRDGKLSNPCTPL